MLSTVYLGVDGQQGPEKEHGDCLMVVWPGPELDNVGRFRAWPDRQLGGPAPRTA